LELLVEVSQVHEVPAFGDLVAVHGQEG
jgi:hypothetical protein